MILHGFPVKEKIKEVLIERIKKLEKKSFLAIVQVGDRADSNVYVRQKQKFGEEIGVKVLINKFDVDIKEEDLTREIKKLNEDESVNGIIVQLPLPKHIDTEKIINLISIQKDVDGLVSRTTLKLPQSQRVVLDTISATARGVLALLDYYEITVKDKKVAVIGQGILAGKPIALELEKRGAEVFRCDVDTPNISEITKGCDILISAVGKAGLITKEFVNPKQVVIDVGINKITPPNPLLLQEGEQKSKIVGDVNFEEVSPIVSSITPVPGGIGPLTVACLFIMGL